MNTPQGKTFCGWLKKTKKKIYFNLLQILHLNHDDYETWNNNLRHLQIPTRWNNSQLPIERPQLHVELGSDHNRPPTHVGSYRLVLVW